MPTYVYACKDCGHGFEIYQSFDEDALSVCPQCKGVLRKQFNTVGVVFKGSGFYKTDSRSSTTEGSTGSSAGSEKTPSPQPAKTDTSSPSTAQN